jgi:hypothetical protein
MALPTSGPLTLTNIQTEFGGTAPTSLNEYYAGGTYVAAGTIGTYGQVPSSGTISVRNFYGTSNAPPIDISVVNYLATQDGLSASASYITSPDSYRWVARSFPTSDTWSASAFGGNTWVVLAYGTSNALYSTNGRDWTATSLPISGNWTSVAFTSGRFVAISTTTGSTNSDIIWSRDGINWNNTSLPSSSYWTKSSGANGKFLATTNVSGARTAAISDNGESWTAVTLPAGSYNWAYAAGVDSILIATSSFTGAGAGTNVTARSTDSGATWSLGGTFPSNGGWGSICFGNGNFVAVSYSASSGGAATTNAAYSTDNGVTWNASTMPSSQKWVGMAYNQDFNRFISLGYQSNVVAGSIDKGVTWTQDTLPVSGNWGYISGKPYENLVLVAGGGGGGSPNSNYNSGGGGAGGLIQRTITFVPGTTYTITIGAGGSANAYGNASQFGSYTVVRGGFGAGPNNPAGTGGSGGGGNQGGSPGQGTAGQGNAGSPGGNASYGAGAGGGAGLTGSSFNGGDGLISAITGTATYYAGGGGGSYNTGGYAVTGIGGQGGGGNGLHYAGAGGSGTVNTGGGGGGNGQNGPATGGPGGSGVCYISVPTSSYTGIYTGSVDVLTNGSYTVLRFKSSGSYTA